MTTTLTAVQEELTESEIEEARSYLETTRDGVVKATEGLSAAQWNYRPRSGGWSVAENLEHMVILQERILGPFSEMLAQSPESPSEEAQIIDGIIKAKFADRSEKFNAPEFVYPTGQWTPAEALEKLSANTKRLIERLESTPRLRAHRIPSPPLNALTAGKYKSMDGYHWILAAAGHNERHTKQILEVQAEPNFPAS